MFIAPERRPTFSTNNRRLCPTLVLVTCIIVSVGCGNSAVQSGPTALAPIATNVSEMAISGRVVPPAGFPLGAEQLRILSVAGDAVAQADGKFVLPMRSDAPGLVMATAPDGRVVFLGPWGGGSEEVELGVRSTALTLVYFRFMVCAFPPQTQKEVLRAIEQDPLFKDFADEIARLIQADPFFVTNGHPSVRIAPERLAGELRNRPKTEAGLAAKLLAPPKEEIRARPVAGDKFTIRPNLLQSGVDLTVDPRGTQVVARNQYRRIRSEFSLYETGYRHHGGATTELSAAVPKLASPLTLAGTPPITSIFNALTFLVSTLAGAENTLEIGTDLMPTDTSRQSTNYSLVMLSPYLGPKEDPHFYRLPAFAGQVANWKAQESQLLVEEWVADIIVPILSFVLNVNMDANLRKSDEFSKVITQWLVNLPVSMYSTLYSQVVSGDPVSWQNATSQFISAISGTQIGGLIAALMKSIEVNEGRDFVAARVEAVAEKFANCNAVIGFTNGCFQVTDGIWLFSHLFVSQKAVKWDIESAPAELPPPPPNPIVGNGYFTNDCQGTLTLTSPRAEVVPCVVTVDWRRGTRAHITVRVVNGGVYTRTGSDQGIQVPGTFLLTQSSTATESNWTVTVEGTGSLQPTRCIVYGNFVMNPNPGFGTEVTSGSFHAEGSGVDPTL